MEGNQRPEPDKYNTSRSNHPYPAGVALNDGHYRSINPQSWLANNELQSQWELNAADFQERYSSNNHNQLYSQQHNGDFSVHMNGDNMYGSSQNNMYGSSQSATAACSMMATHTTDVNLPSNSFGHLDSISNSTSDAVYLPDDTTVSFKNHSNKEPTMTHQFVDKDQMDFHTLVEKNQINGFFDSSTTNSEYGGKSCGFHEQQQPAFNYRGREEVQLEQQQKQPPPLLINDEEPPTISMPSNDTTAYASAVGKSQTQNMSGNSISSLHKQQKRSSFTYSQSSLAPPTAPNDASTYMFYTFAVDSDGNSSFPYVSEKVREMFMMTPEFVYSNPEVLLGTVIEQDKVSLQTSILSCYVSLKPWRYTGRYLIPSAGEIKCIVGRATNFRLPDGTLVSNGILSDCTPSYLREQSRAMVREEILSRSYNTATSTAMSEEQIGSLVSNELIKDHQSTVQRKETILLLKKFVLDLLNRRCLLASNDCSLSDEMAGSLSSLQEIYFSHENKGGDKSSQAGVIYDVNRDNLNLSRDELTDIFSDAEFDDIGDDFMNLLGESNGSSLKETRSESASADLKVREDTAGPLPLVETLKQSYRESRARKKRNISSNKGYPDDTANTSSSSSSFDQKSKVKPKRSFVTDSTQNHNNKTKNKVDHFYVDYSLVREEDIHRKLPISGTPINDILRGVHSIHVHSKGIEDPEGRKVTSFPMKLMSLLSYPQLQKVVSWKQHGRAFVIKDSEAFEKEVWPRFSNPTKFRSFVRQLSMWGFRRLTQGPDLGCYYNEFFLRGKPNLLIKMKCTKIKGVGTKLYPNPADEPNFYELELHRPLPQLSLVTGPLPPKKEV